MGLRLDALSRRAKLRQRRTGVTVPTPVGAIVAEAAELLRRRELARAAWDRVASPEWLADTLVTGVPAERKDTVTISVTNSTLLYELRRQQSALERSLSRLAPGTRRICFTIGSRPGNRAPKRA